VGKVSHTPHCAMQSELLRHQYAPVELATNLTLNECNVTPCGLEKFYQSFGGNFKEGGSKFLRLTELVLIRLNCIYCGIPHR
jgi:hypothetical protein